MKPKYNLADLEKAKDEGQGDNTWLVILSDMMMLLLTFFVMLFIIIEPADQNYVGVLRKIGDALGGVSLVERKTDMSRLQDSIEKIIEDNNLVKRVHLATDARGIVLFAEGDIFFKSGEATLTKEVKRLLRRIGGLLEKNQYKVVVEGHTDDVPIKSALFPSNWELSTARASSVVRYFVDEMKLEPRRFAAMGYAQHKPRYALIPENRPRNRRVEIVILRERL